MPCKAFAGSLYLKDDVIHQPHLLLHICLHSCVFSTLHSAHLNHVPIPSLLAWQSIADSIVWLRHTEQCCFEYQVSQVPHPLWQPEPTT